MRCRVSWGWASGVLVAAALLAVPAAAVADTATDAAIRSRIEARLARAKLDATTHVGVTVENGVARLSGTATSLVDSRAAAKVARKETKDVVNRVLVEPVPRTDAEIRKDAVSAILRYPYYGVYDAVGVDVDNGAVTLRGWMLQPWQRSNLEEDVARVAGVRALDDKIEVESALFTDWRLRREIYHRIYDSLTFEPWANQFDKPVRIIVDNGRVILAGRVSSTVEKQVAGNIARDTLAFSVDNQVRVEVPPAKPSKTAPAPAGIVV